MIKGRLRGVVGGVDYNELGRFREGSENYRRGFMEAFNEGLESGQIKPDQFRLRRLFEHLVEGGREILDSWNPENKGSSSYIMLREDGATISTADFNSISGQIIFAAVLEAWDNPMMLHPQLMDDVQTPFRRERVPGLGNFGDIGQTIGEGKPYPTAGFNEEFQDTPETTKKGVITEVTKEAAFFDRLGQVLQHARDLTSILLINKEIRCIDAAVGVTDSYSRNGGAVQATYGASHTNGDFNNLKTSNGLTDWTNVEAAELMFDDITDPNTGQPVMIDKTRMQILCATAKNYSATFALSPDVTRREDRGGSAAATIVETRGRNPVRQYPVLSNAYVKSRSSSSTTWWLGDFRGAFEYRQNWPITSVTRPAGSEAEFRRDIIQESKISEMGTPWAKRPQLVVKNTA